MKYNMLISHLGLKNELKLIEEGWDLEWCHIEIDGFMTYENQEYHNCFSHEEFEENGVVRVNFSYKKDWWEIDFFLIPVKDK